MTVRELVLEWRDLGVGRTPATIGHNLQMVAPFARAHGDLRLDQVTPIIAQRWAARNPGHVRYLKAMFADAERVGLCAENPFSRTRFAVEARMDRTPPSVPMLHRIAAEARPCFRPVIWVAAYTGLRCSELAAVQARDVLEVPSLRVVVREGKGGRRGDLVPVFGEAREVLLDAKAGRDVGRLFVTERGRAWSRSSVSRAWRQAAGACGFESTFHCLRRFFATWLIDRGASYQDVAVGMRHFDAAGRPNIELVARLYGHPDAGAALARLEAL